MWVQRTTPVDFLHFALLSALEAERGRQPSPTEKSVNMKCAFLIKGFTERVAICGYLEMMHLLHHCRFLQQTCTTLVEDPASDEKHPLRHTLENACLGGHLDVVKYVHEQLNVPLNTSCWMAAEYAHRDVMEYLHEKKCPWQDNSLAQAACYGHKWVVIWLIQRGYVTSLDACETAIERTKDSGVLNILRTWAIAFPNFDVSSLGYQFLRQGIQIRNAFGTPL